MTQLVTPDSAATAQAVGLWRYHPPGQVSLLPLKGTGVFAELQSLSPCGVILKVISEAVSPKVQFDAEVVLDVSHWPLVQVPHKQLSPLAGHSGCGAPPPKGAGVGVAEQVSPQTPVHGEIAGQLLVGAGDGGAVGSGVGTFVGASVGEDDGGAAGSGVGTFVGASVGEDDGGAVGSGVGTFVGASVGAGDGGAVGSGVGTFVGASVGEDDGGAVFFFAPENQS
eukprot:scaffold3010_cov79-Skeletonema_menzelii.AAC.3